MSSAQGLFTAFVDVEDMLDFFNKNKDGITGAMIPQAPSVKVTYPGKAPVAIPGVGLVLELSTGHNVIFGKQDAEIVLNDGILNRQQIPIRLSI
jgi:hypothetical protein